MPTFYGAIVISIVTILICASCTDKNCTVINKFPSGRSKTVMCQVGNELRHYCSTDFYENGNIKVEFCLVNELVEGEVIIYYESGMIKEKSWYEKDEKAGPSFEYNEDGKLIAHHIYFQNEIVYSRTYNNDTLSENFIPIVDYKFDSEKDSSFVKISLKFPLPDSIANRYDFSYVNGVGLSDSENALKIENEVMVKINTKDSTVVTLPIPEMDGLTYAGYLVDEKTKKTYSGTVRRLCRESKEYSFCTSDPLLVQ
ncbi:MAG: hypothetical protein WBA17_11945 [Saprospiraceae bacterium]